MKYIDDKGNQFVDMEEMANSQEDLASWYCAELKGQMMLEINDRIAAKFTDKSSVELLLGKDTYSKLQRMLVSKFTVEELISILSILGGKVSQISFTDKTTGKTQKI